MRKLVALYFGISGTWAFGQIPSPSAPAAPGTIEPSASAQASAQATAQGKMTASLERQKASVRKQASSAVEIPETAAKSWFTVPWDAPALAAGVQPPVDCPELAPTRLDEMIEKTAQGEKLPSSLLREVIRQESGFQPCAVSSKGALGLMQLMPETAAGFGVVDAFNPEENLAAGAKFLAGLIERYKGDKKLALAAYNSGVDRVAQYRGVPPFPETENYVKQILERVDAAKDVK